MWQCTNIYPNFTRLIDMFNKTPLVNSIWTQVAVGPGHEAKFRVLLVEDRIVIAVQESAIPGLSWSGSMIDFLKNFRYRGGPETKEVAA